MSIVSRLLRTRWVVRAPISAFKLGLGFVFGGRLVMLEHVGRTSGEPRFVVLEVVSRPHRREVVVASGFGRSAQWFRNLEANPQCHVSVGAMRRIPAVAATLSHPVAEGVLARYQREHPATWRRLAAAIVEATGDEHPDIPLVRLSLENPTATARRM